jgi:predicted glycosyl hydrolase (DUF1957 family)
VAFTIDWATVQLVWSDPGYPSDGAYLEYHRLSKNGMRLWSISGTPYNPAAAAKRATEHAASFLAAVRDRLERHRAETDRRASACSQSTRSCSATGGRRGPLWLREVIKGPSSMAFACSPAAGAPHTRA